MNWESGTDQTIRKSGIDGMKIGTDGSISKSGLGGIKIGYI